MEQADKIYIAGHRGMVGSGLERKLRKEGYNNIVKRTSSELDLRNQQAVNDFFEKEKPVYVILAAAKVGGIHANNTYRAEFIYDNLMIEANIIHAAYLNKVTKLLFLGSSCIYPKMAPQPLKEEYLLSGYLEPTNQPYAIAKIAGIEMCDSYRAQYGCNFISAMPTNLYGTNDNYHPENSHVLPALIRRIFLAKKNNEPYVTIWGTGTPRREFLHVDDLADACFFLLQNYNEQGLVNIGCGSDVSIIELAELIISEVGYQGKIVFDKTKPDGTTRKLMDTSKINNLGWNSSIELNIGIQRTINEVNFLF
jgi:GDP-L-fucose synthase